MNDNGPEARQLLAALRERPVSVEPARRQERRKEVVAHLRLLTTELSQRRARRVRFRRIVIGAAAVAAAATLVLSVAEQWSSLEVAATDPTLEARMVRGQVVHRASGVERVILAGESLKMPMGGELQTDDRQSAQLRTTGGLELDISAASRVSLSGMTATAEQRRVTLLQGRLDCRVPKLQPERGFAVVTPNARAVVHGTEFSVNVETIQEGVTRTCVHVREGVVAVHHADGEVRLHAGEEWGCEPLVKVAQPVQLPPGSGMQTKATAPRKSSAVGDADSAGSRSTLAEETRLLQAALAAERRGQQNVAASHLRAFIKRYPASPLFPEANEALKRISSSAPMGQ